MKDTKDIYLAALYIAKGAQFSHADKSDVRHQVFWFFDSDELDMDDIRNKYINGHILVNAVAFKEAIQRMKSEIHSN